MGPAGSAANPTRPRSGASTSTFKFHSLPQLRRLARSTQLGDTVQRWSADRGLTPLDGHTVRLWAFAQLERGRSVAAVDADLSALGALVAAPADRRRWLADARAVVRAMAARRKHDGEVEPGIGQPPARCGAARTPPSAHAQPRRPTSGCHRPVSEILDPPTPSQEGEN